MKPENRSAFLFLFRYIIKYWYHILIGLGAIVASSLLQVITPVFIGSAIDFIRATDLGQVSRLSPFVDYFIDLEAPPSNVLLQFSIVLVVIAILLGTARIINRVFLTGIGRHVEYDLLND